MTNKCVKIIGGYDLSGLTKRNLHGMTIQQYYDLLEHQQFKCPLSGKEFTYDPEKCKFVDINDKVPPVDHDHNTGYIRGILTEKINWLESQWELGTYGQLTKPVELTEYQNNPPAYDVIGKIFYN